MGAYISLNQVLALAEKATNSSFRQIPRKKIMFRTTTAEGKSVTLCSPQSKLHSQGFFWVDITQEQYRVLSETDSGLVIFRLEGMKLAMVKWLSIRLTSSIVYSIVAPPLPQQSVVEKIDQI